MTVVARMLGITEKEWPRARSMAMLCLMLMAALAIGRSARDAFFIKNAGVDNLPFVYVINGILVATIAAVYTRVVHRLSLTRFLGILCIVFASCILLFRGALQLGFNSKVVPYAIWSLAELYNILALMHFWTLANTVFDPREAKRLFPLIGGVGLTGMILGGILTPVWIHYVGSNNLLFLWAGAVLFALPFVRLAAQSTRASGIVLQGHDTELRQTVLEGWRDLWKIPLMRTLTYVAFAMWTTAWLIDFQFFHTLDEVYKDQDSLAGFLGLFGSLTSFVGLLIQFFVTGRLLQAIGVGGVAVLYPTAVAVSAGGLCLRGFAPAGSHQIMDARSLAAVGAKFTDETLFSSTHDSVIALLFNSLPDDIRAGARAFLTGAMEPIATACAGLLLLVLTRLDFPFWGFSVLTFSVSGIWIALALRIKPDYLRALVANLNSRNIDLQRTAYSLLSERRDVETREILLASVASADEEMALFAVELLDTNDLDIVQRLCALLPHATNRLKVSLLQYLGQAGHLEARGAVHAELQSADGLVRATAIRALGRLKMPSDIKELARFLKDRDALVSSEAIGIYLKQTGSLRKQALVKLDKMLTSSDDDLRFKAARILNENPEPTRLERLVKMIDRGGEISRIEGVRALGKIRSTKALTKLAAYLSNDDIYLTVKESLLAYGDLALPALHAELQKQNDAESKLKVIHCLGEIASLKSIAVLSKFIVRQPILVENAAAEALTNVRMKFLNDPEADVEQANQHFSPDVRERIRHSYFSVVENFEKDQHAIRSLEGHSGLEVGLVLDALRRFSGQRLEIALKFLELIADPRTIRALASDLQFGEARPRAEAMEALEGSCEEAGSLVRALESVEKHARETAPIDQILRNIFWKNHPPWITACALRVVGQLGLKALEPELFVYLEHEDELVSLNARVALQKFRSKAYRSILAGDSRRKTLEKETKKMDTRMERFLFLRSVPLFSDVDGQDLHWINEITHEQKFKSRQTIFREGDPGESLYIIINGSVRVFKGQKGKEITIDILQERDCFGEMAILDQEPRSASVTSLKNTRLLVIHRGDFQRLLIARPRISFALFKTMSKRVRDANTRLLKLQKTG
ncbi:MAG: cyclic nucleotide-binding domain-containing protein [Spirochaetia bacterium]|nr:cyclic nucleotide-binding domain-containing protein [Spirochaetia bacterium]